jgi:uncharacterized protein YoxC
MPVTGSVGALLLQAAGVGAAQQAVSGDRTLEIVAIVAVVMIALILIALLVALIPAVRSVRKVSEKLEAMLDRASADLDPIAGHAKKIADNVDYISTTVRADVGDVSLTVKRANARVNEALDASERRVKELGALLRLFQDEVEHTLVSGTSVLRGFRAGADALRDGTIGFLDGELDELEDEADDFDELIDEPDDFPESGTILDSDEIDEIDEDIEDILEEGEESDDGYDWARDGGDGRDDREERPRIRRRPAP